MGGALRRTPPLGALPAVLRLRGREAPVDVDFSTWARSHTDERTAALLSSAAGVFTFHHDPGELSAAFVWPRMVRLLLPAPSIVRYPVGGWSTLVASLERRVRELGVDVETETRVEELPAHAGDPRDRARPGARAARRRQPALAERATRSAWTSACATAAETRRSSPTWTSRAGSVATRPPTRRSRPTARS